MLLSIVVDVDVDVDVVAVGVGMRWRRWRGSCTVGSTALRSRRI